MLLIRIFKNKFWIHSLNQELSFTFTSTFFKIIVFPINLFRLNGKHYGSCIQNKKNKSSGKSLQINKSLKYSTNIFLTYINIYLKT